MSAFLWGKSSNKRKGKEAGVGNGTSAGLLARMRDFKDDTAGDIAIMFGLLAFVMFMFVGAAVDMGRWLHARKQMLDAVDAAVLAAGRELQTTGDENKAIAAAEKFFNESIEGRLQGVSMEVNFKVAEVDGGLTVGVDAGSFAKIDTPFMSLGGVATLPLLNTAGAEWSQAKLATEGNAQQNFEISMMLDISGSMNMPSTKIADLRLAAEDLINIVVWADQSEYTSKVAILPFSSDMRPPASVFANVTDPAAPASKQNSCYKLNSKGKCVASPTYYKSKCVVERAGIEKYTDAAPGAGKYLMIEYDDSNSSNNYCANKPSAELMPLSSDKAALVSKVQTMELGGGTAGHIGTAWAWYALSPNWNSVWPNSANHAANYGDAGTKKIAILMTDGMYNRQYNSDGITTGSTGYSSTPANDTAQIQALALCQGMKSKGITVYTVGFDLASITPLSEQIAARSILSTCATDPTKFYDATDGAALRQAFRTIALEISSLYLDK